MLQYVLLISSEDKLPGSRPNFSTFRMKLWLTKERKAAA